MSRDFLKLIEKDDLPLIRELATFCDNFREPQGRVIAPPENSVDFIRTWLLRDKFGEKASAVELARVLGEINNLYNHCPETCRMLLIHAKARIVDAVWPGGGEDGLSD